MPRILVLAERPGVPESRLVLEERMVAADLDSERASAQLVERSTETHVSEMLRYGATLAEIEDFVDRQPISEEHRAVLWLQAWAEQTDAPARRRLARVRPICNPGD